MKLAVSLGDTILYLATNAVDWTANVDVSYDEQVVVVKGFTMGSTRKNSSSTSRNDCSGPSREYNDVLH